MADSESETTPIVTDEIDGEIDRETTETTDEIITVGEDNVATKKTSEDQVVPPQKQEKAPPKAPLLSVEIPLFLYFVAFGIFSPAQQEFIYQRICLFKYDNNQALCDLIDTTPIYQDQEDAVQAEYSTFSTFASLCTWPPAMIATILMGMWVDRFSHRLALIVPHLGCIAVSGLYLAYYYLPAFNSTLNPIYLSIISTITGLSGYTATEIMACSSYISCVSTGPNRTVRLGVVQGTVVLGQAVGFLLNAFLFSKGNYLIAFVIQIAINCYACATAFAFVPELRSLKEVAARVREEARGSWCRFLCAPQTVLVDSFKLFFSVKTDKTKFRLAMLFAYALSAAVIGIFPLQAVTYAFLTLQPISISKFWYAIFQAVYNLVAGFCLVIGVRWIRMKCCCGFFPFSDAAIAVLGGVSRFLALTSIGLGEYYPTYAPWVYAGVNMAGPLAFLSLRSGMSKLTEPSDQGRLFAMVAVVENAFLLTSSLGFTALYGLLISETDDNTSPLAPIIHGYTFFFVAGLALVFILVAIVLGRKPIPGWCFHSSEKKTAVAAIKT